MYSNLNLYLLSSHITEAVEYTYYTTSEAKNLPNVCSRYDTKQSDSDALVQELWGMWSTLSLLLFPGQLLPGVAVTVGITDVT